MAVRISIVVAARTVYSIFSETLTAGDFTSGRSEVASHPDFDPTFAHVLDFTDVAFVDVEQAAMRDLSAMRSIFERDALQVVVVTRTSPVYGIAQTFKAFAVGTGRNIRMAESLDEAHALVIAFG